jgi:hypothetical protein
MNTLGKKFGEMLLRKSEKDEPLQKIATGI